MKKMLLATCALGTVGLMGTAPAPVFAQQTAQANALEEIIVTTRKREENLLEVPLAITALTEADIERSGISNVSQLATQTVGFTYHQGFGRLGSGQGGGASNRPSIRGMSNVLGRPNAGFFVDGIYVSGNPSSYQLDNLARIEVARGPQAALFGRGTFAGAINFVTRRPDNEWRGKLEGTVAQHDHQEVNGYASGPLITDRLFAEVNARYYKFGGDYFNEITREKDIGFQRTKNVGGKIVATPNDDLTIEVSAGYSHDQDLGFADFFHGSAKNNCFLPRLGTPVAGIPRNTIRSQGFFCGEIQLPQQFYQFNDVLKASGEWGSERKVFRAHAKIDYDIGDWTLTSVTAFNRSKDWQLIDQFVDGIRLNANGTARGQVSGGHTQVKDWSQELRFTSPEDSRLRALGGVYYYKEDNGGGYSQAASVIPATLGQITITNRFNDDASGVRNWAVFGHVDYDLTDSLVATVEARYQEDKLLTELGTLSPAGTILATLPDGIADARAKYKAFLPRVSLKYEFEENSNIYASVAKGNKPGDFTAIPANISAASLATVIAQQAFVVKEERSWNYEIGYKGALLDNRLVLTSALFWIDWSNQSVTSGFPIQQQNGTFTTLARQVNAGKSRVRGFELDASVAASDFFDFRVGYSFNDAKIRDYVDETERDLRDTNGVINNPADTDPSGQVAGRQIPQVPKHQIILSGNFHMPIMSGDWEAFFRQDFTFESKRYENVQNLAFAGNSYLLNLRAGIENDTWSLTLFYNNALNDKTPTVVTRLFDFNRTLLIPDPVQTFAGQPLRLTFFRDFRVGAPRRPQFGLTAIYKF